LLYVHAELQFIARGGQQLRFISAVFQFLHRLRQTLVCQGNLPASFLPPYRVPQQKAEKHHQRHQEQTDKRNLGADRRERTALRTFVALLQKPLFAVGHQTNRLLALLQIGWRNLGLEGEGAQCLIQALRAGIQALQVAGLVAVVLYQSLEVRKRGLQLVPARLRAAKLLRVPGKRVEAAAVVDPLGQQRDPLQRGEHILGMLNPFGGRDQLARVAKDQRPGQQRKKHRSESRHNQQRHPGIWASQESQPLSEFGHLCCQSRLQKSVTLMIVT
jgi:hypothetical protein